MYGWKCFEFPDLPAGQNQAAGADDWTTFNTAGVRTAFTNSGDQSMRLAPNAPTGNGSGICRQEFELGVGVFDDTAYSMGAFVYNDSNDPITGSRQAELRIQWLNSNGQVLNQAIEVVADANTSTDEWIFVSLENVMIPDNANIAEVRAALFVTNGGGTGGGPVFFDDVTFVQGPTAVINQTEIVPADNFTVFRGVLLSGQLSDTVDSDDSRVLLNPGFVLNNLEAPVWLIFDGTLSNATPSSLSMDLESQAGTPGLTATLEAFNWNTGVFDVVGTSPETFNVDSLTTVDLSSSTSDFVDAGGEVRGRVGWRQTGFTLNFPWEVRVDAFNWIAE